MVTSFVSSLRIVGSDSGSRGAYGPDDKLYCVA